MNRFILRVINSEDIYKTNLNYTSNINGKSIPLTNESVVVDELLSQGGFGTVYKCHNAHSMLALKKLCVNSIDKLLTCIQEIYILKFIDNDHIMRYVDSIIYESGEDIYDVFILTELYRGNLCSLMRTMRASNRAFDEAMVVHAMSHIVKAVASLHQAAPTPIIHRDLKVENVLIAYPQRYVLCDFGSATLKEVRPCDVDRQDLQEEISRCTTLSYRSPEMTDLYLDGGEHIIGRKSDIWALGVLMYNICFFTLPFGESVLSIMSGNITVPDTHGYSNDLMKLLHLCLTTNPKERPDIYQLSTLTFSLLCEPNPIRNTENSAEPSLDNIVLPLTESEAKASNCQRIKKDKHMNACVITKPVSTSIKPRERPKPGDKGIVPQQLSRPTQSNNSNSATNLSELQSQLKVEQHDDWSMNQSSMSVLTKAIDGSSNRTSQLDDLIDFNVESVNHKINKLANVSKSQSLGKNFGTTGTGQYCNIHQMISQSYQNVPGFPQPMYSSNTPPNLEATFPRNYGPQYNYPHAISQPQFYTVNHTNSYSYGMNVGHRRLVSEPVRFINTTNGPGTTVFHQSDGILKPSKVAVPIKRTSVLNEFDPLID